MGTAVVDKEWLVCPRDVSLSQMARKTQTLYPGSAWIQLCPTPEHLEARLPGRVTPRAVTLQYAHGGNLASVLTQNRSSKEPE